ncbi:hypothetical protein [Pelotalea chapellei]|uniref:Uncharacterized protein n=1 Tax=Pelotalea chapellei TaxID=44671 RepID=A0ABS5UB74_9BACT|nr:hypothetical protein [Pelotalea chapellei]MBT1072948.1 hypothetical protein [Pelotalea chapellei]
MLPFVIVAAVLFISQGINLSKISNPQEPKLSSLQKGKPSTTAITKTLLQSSQLKTTKKSAQYLVFINFDHQVKSPVTYLSSRKNKSSSFSFTAISVVSARAPPA